MFLAMRFYGSVISPKDMSNALLLMKTVNKFGGDNNIFLFINLFIKLSTKHEKKNIHLHWHVSVTDSPVFMELH